MIDVDLKGLEGNFLMSHSSECFMSLCNLKDKYIILSAQIKLQCIPIINVYILMDSTKNLSPTISFIT